MSEPKLNAGSPVGVTPPSARRWSGPLTVLVIFTILGLIESTKAWISLQARGVGRSFGTTLIGNMPWWYAWGLLTPVCILLVRRFRFDRGRWWVSAGVHAVAALVLSMVHLVSVSALYWMTHGRYSGMIDSMAMQIRNIVDGFIILDLVTYAGIIGVISALQYHRDFREKERAAAKLQLHAAQMESTMNQARLDALRMELNPHFLFNALNAISGLVRRGDNGAAVSVLARLGELLRVTLERDAAQEVPLETELEFLQGYLEIERIRFHDRLSIDVDVDANAMSALVPTLILQPLVENAVRHGIARRPGPGRVSIGAHLRNGDLVLQVRDTGVGFNGETSRRGVGLSNTESRLERLYGAQARLQLGAGPEGGAEVSVTIPFRTGSEEVSPDAYV